MMRTCTKCSVERPIEDFHFRNKEKGIRKTSCRECHSSYMRGAWRDTESYAKHKKRVYQRKKEKLAEAQEYVFEYLSIHPCKICEETDPIVLEFDHIDPTTKSFDICIGIQRGINLSVLISEIEKCRVLCANCHKRHTAKTQNWYKYRLASALASTG